MVQKPQMKMYQLMRVPWAGTWTLRNYALRSKRYTAT